MGDHSGDRRSVESLSSTGALIGLFLLFLAAFAIPDSVLGKSTPTITEVERELTTTAILVRTGLKPCANDEAMENLAGSQLEEFFRTHVEALPEKAYSKSTVKRLATSECLKSCTCSARLKIIENAPEKLREADLTQPLEQALAKMTDEDYGRCRKTTSSICTRPEVRAFLRQIKDELK